MEIKALSKIINEKPKVKHKDDSRDFYALKIFESEKIIHIMVEDIDGDIYRYDLNDLTLDIGEVSLEKENDITITI